MSTLAENYRNDWLDELRREEKIKDRWIEASQVLLECSILAMNTGLTRLESFVSATQAAQWFEADPNLTFEETVDAFLDYLEAFKEENGK